MKKSELKQIIREEIRLIREIEGLDLEQPFGVVEIGGAIGGTGKFYIPGKGRLIYTFDTKEEAMNYAKRRRSQLSPGEKSYYKMGYKIIEITPSIKKILSK